MVLEDRPPVVAAHPPTESTLDPAQAGWTAPRLLHRSSHLDLLHQLGQTGQEPAGSADAIIVPTNRSAGHLRPAADLAARLECQLVVIYTGNYPAALPAVLCELDREQVTVIGLDKDYQHERLDFLTQRHPEAVSPAHLDISRKRNLGLLISRICDWQRVLFLDDDIYEIDPEQVAVAAAVLDSYPVAGFKVTHYPDNSVVCHAYRLAGGEQDTFIGGNALMIDPTRTDSFFPPIYNEDWLFLAKHIQLGNAGVAGTVRQVGYAPFQDPARAFSEEFGDVFAEGIYGLLHEGADPHGAGLLFWRDMLRRREKFIDEIATRLVAADHGKDIEPALLALTAAAKRLHNLAPLDFVSFARAWRIDLAAWREGLEDLPTAGSIAKATEHLGLTSMIGQPDERG